MEFREIWLTTQKHSRTVQELKTIFVKLSACESGAYRCRKQLRIVTWSTGIQGPHLRTSNLGFNPGLTPQHLLYKEGANPGLKPGFGILRCGLSTIQYSWQYRYCITLISLQYTLLYLLYSIYFCNYFLHNSFHRRKQIYWADSLIFPGGIALE
jgi:hypothetical protein